jgi:hypothetical protein
MLLESFYFPNFEAFRPSDREDFSAFRSVADAKKPSLT